MAGSRKREIRAVVVRYSEALNQRSAEKLFGLLSDKIQVEGMTDELSRAGLKAGMHWPPSAIMRSQILSISRNSGAQINLVPNLNGIESHFRRVESGTKISDGGEYGRQTALLGFIDATSIGGIRYQHFPFAVFEVPYLSGQGIIGSPLVQKSRLEINFPKKSITIW